MAYNLFDVAVGSLRSSGPLTLNWLFLVESIVVIILVLFYFFYFNRIAGIFVSFLLRLLFWRSNNAYFEIGGLQFAPLGGRIIFTDFRYISRNQSLSIIRGHITWKYWLRRVRSEEDRPEEARLPCRVTVSLTGAEWFLYNRTPSYDAILEQLGLQDPLGPSSTNSSSSETKEKASADTPPPATADEVVEGEGKKKDATDWMREALPIEILCKTGSIIMGNVSTSNIVIAGFQEVAGSYAAVKSRSQFDEYKQVYRLTFTQPKIVFRTNPDYEGPMVKHGEDVLEKLNADPDFDLVEFLRNPSLYGSIQRFRQLLRKIHIPRLSPHPNPSKSTPTSSSHPWSWQGLPRYHSSSEDAAGPGHSIEYAKVTTLLASPELEMTYYCDTAGKVPSVPRMVTGFVGLETCDIGNGDLSPEWGVDVVVRGGVLTYGPWADRQRAELQQAFTPTTFFNVTTTPILKAGDERMHTALKIFVEFSEATVLRIPTREFSKDWKYDGVDVGSLSDATVRPYGWLDIALGSNSTISYVLPMIATSVGYDSQVELHLVEMSIASSVNYATFVQTETCRIHIGMPAPLIWDEMRTWTVSVTMSKPDISLLRDHITLLADVAKDWTSGPPGDYEHFVPYNYDIDVTISDYTLRLFVNDHNIINNPGTMEDNTLMISRGPKLGARVTVPADKYRMECSVIPFQISMIDLALSMTLPDWNTHSAFLTTGNRNFATTPELNIVGTYRFYATASPENVEKLQVAVDCHDVSFITMGWMVRHLFNLRDNYFGTFTHFVTLEEYRHRHERNLQGDPLELKYRPGAADAFEVVVSLQLRNGLLVLPEELYDCSSAIVIANPHLQVELRNHDYFMEMSVNAEPFRVLHTTNCESVLKQDFATIMEHVDTIKVQGFDVTANRLFGPQPRTATYICIWSIYFGAITGSIPPSFLQAISRAVSSIATNFVDQDNSLPPDFTVALDPDATFVTVDLGSIDLAIRGSATAIQVALLEGVKIRFDDLASAPYLKHISLEAPSLDLRFLAPLFGRAAPWMEVASLETDLSVVVGSSSSGWEEIARTQMDFIESQDVSTMRCPFIYGQTGEVSSTHIGSLYLSALGAPIRGVPHTRQSSTHPSSVLRDSRGRRRSSTMDLDDSEREYGDEEDDTETDSGATSSDSETPDDDYETLYTRLPGRLRAGDRFSAYGAILQLCERAPEAAFGDKPTFRRLKSVVTEGQFSSKITDDGTRTPTSVDDRLKFFGAPRNRDSSDRTSIDVSFRKSIRIVLTPVAVQVGADVLDSMEDGENFEHRLDELHKEYIGSRNPAPSIRYNTTELRVSLPSIEVESIQDVLRPEETISIKARDSRNSDSTILCTTRLNLDQVSIFYTQTEDAFGSDTPTLVVSPTIIERTLSASALATRLQIFSPSHTVSSTRTRRSLPITLQRPRPTALDLTIGLCELNFDFSLERALVALKGGDARLDFVDEAAELVIGSLWSWRVIHDVAGPLAERAAKRKATLRHLIWSIAEASDKSNIVSFPTFLNRVSYLVGSSANLRSDDGWKILHHLRHCLRLAQVDVAARMEESHAWPVPAELLGDVVGILSRWSSWEMETDDLVGLPLLASIYGAPSLILDDTLQPGSLGWQIPFKIEWRAGRFQAYLSDGRLSDNWLAAGPVEAFLSSSGRPAAGKQLQLQARATLHLLEANVDRDLLLLARHILQVRRTFERKIQVFRNNLAQSTIEPDVALVNTTPSFFASMPTTQVDASFGVNRIVGVGLADDLEAKAEFSNVAGSISVFIEPNLSRSSRPLAHQVNATTSLTVGWTSLAAREATNPSDAVLLSAELEETSVIGTATGSHAWSGKKRNEVPSLSIIFAVRAIRARVPRDAIRIYEFTENWRNKSLPTYDSLLAELRDGLDDIQATVVERPTESPSLAELLLAKAQLGVQVIIPLVSLEMQAIPTLKVKYLIHDISAYARNVEGSKQGDKIGVVDAGLAVGSQTIKFLTLTDGEGPDLLPADTTVELPVFRLKAQLDGIPCRRITLLATIDSVSLTLTAAVLDYILTVQSRFGSDIDELLRVVRTKRARLEDSVKSEELVPTASSVFIPIAWDARVALRGFKVGVEGPHATQWIEAELLEGYARSSSGTLFESLRWEASVQNLSLSLSQRVEDVTAVPTAATDRRYRLAFFRLDVSVSNNVIHLPDLPPASVYDGDDSPHLHLRFTRLHAVLQPTAIEALGDLVDHFVHEIELRRTSRRTEVEAVRKLVIQTLDAGDKPLDPATRSWIASCVVSFEAESVGMAIPLNDDGIPPPDARFRRGKSAQSRPAFLVTIPSIKFATQRGSAAYARMDQLALQFVSDFDPGRKEDFDGPKHQSLNRIVFPEMHCKLRATQGGSQIAVESRVSGIEIDLESTAVAFAFSLVDVYRLSNERFVKFSAQNGASVLPIPTSSPSTPSPPMSVKATFEFESGTIRTHSQASAWNRRSDSPASPSSPRVPVRPKSHRRGRSVGNFGQFRDAFTKTDTTNGLHADIFLIPGLSVWAGFQDGESETDLSNLHVDIVIHTSNNTLYPTLIPFVSTFASQLKDRALQASPSLAPVAVEPSPVVDSAASTSLFSRLQLGVSLRVDQSRLEISCLPMAEVTARLAWTSGGFLLNISPNFQHVDFALSVEGVATGLRHSYSPEDCLLAEAKGLSASITYDAGDGSAPGILSAIVDLPKISAEMNFRHLQDWLCLKAVWIDRLELPSTTDASTPPPSTVPSNVTTLVVARVGVLAISFDLGQAIGKSNFVVHSIRSRLRRVVGESKLVSIGVGKVELVAQGRVGGSAELGGILFETKVRDDGVGRSISASDLLHIEIGLGRLSGSLDYEFHKLLLVDTDPIFISVSDDWSRATSKDAALQLSFTVKMGSLSVVATVATVPTLVGVSRRVQALVNEKAVQAATTIANSGMPARPSMTTRHADAVSLVASALSPLESSPSNQPFTDLPIQVLNRLDISLSSIRIAVFTSHFGCGEVYLLDTGSTRSLLARSVATTTTPSTIHRDLQLHLGFFSLRKVLHRKLTATQERQYTVSEWYELFKAEGERNIFKVPMTEVGMESEQRVGGSKLEHKFSMEFGGQVDMALNYALLRDLSILATSYQAQMETATSSFRAAPSTPAILSASPLTISTLPDVTIASVLSPPPESPLASVMPEVDPLDPTTVRLSTGRLGFEAGHAPQMLEYHALEMNVHQPKLNLLGEATPPLEWMGLQRARFPAWIHKGVTAPLEELLLVLSSTYQNQLARQKLDERQRDRNREEEGQDVVHSVVQS